MPYGISDKQNFEPIHHKVLILKCSLIVRWFVFRRNRLPQLWHLTAKVKYDAYCKKSDVCLRCGCLSIRKNGIGWNWNLNIHHTVRPVKTQSIIHKCALLWRHNDRDGVSNHQPHDCLLNRYSGADQRKHQSSPSMAFVWGIHRGPVNSPHKWPVTRKMFPFDDVIMGFGPFYQQGFTKQNRDYGMGKSIA